MCGAAVASWWCGLCGVVVVAKASLVGDPTLRRKSQPQLEGKKEGPIRNPEKEQPKRKKNDICSSKIEE